MVAQTTVFQHLADNRGTFRQLEGMEFEVGVWKERRFLFARCFRGSLLLAREIAEEPLLHHVVAPEIVASDEEQQHPCREYRHHDPSVEFDILPYGRQDESEGHENACYGKPEHRPDVGLLLRRESLHVDVDRAGPDAEPVEERSHHRKREHHGDEPAGAFGKVREQFFKKRNQIVAAGYQYGDQDNPVDAYTEEIRL